VCTAVVDECLVLCFLVLLWFFTWIEVGRICRILQLLVQLFVRLLAGRKTAWRVHSDGRFASRFYIRSCLYVLHTFVTSSEFRRHRCVSLWPLFFWLRNKSTGFLFSQTLLVYFVEFFHCRYKLVIFWGKACNVKRVLQILTTQQFLQVLHVLFILENRKTVFDTTLLLCWIDSSFYKSFNYSFTSFNLIDIVGALDYFILKCAPKCAHRRLLIQLIPNLKLVEWSLAW
jgi:hypothetical protein